jgi:hypothetical protein
MVINAVLTANLVNEQGTVVTDEGDKNDLLTAYQQVFGTGTASTAMPAQPTAASPINTTLFTTALGQPTNATGLYVQWSAQRDAALQAYVTRLKQVESSGGAPLTSQDRLTLQNNFGAIRANVTLLDAQEANQAAEAQSQIEAAKVQQYHDEATSGAIQHSGRNLPTIEP